MDSQIAALMKKVNSKLGEGTIILGSEMSREVRPRCPSGSLTLDIALGGGWPLNQWNEIIGYECLAPGTTILCTDLVWRSIEDLRVGDRIIGFDEEPGGRGKGRSTQFRRAEVMSLGRDELPCFDVVTRTGVTRASGGHLWLVNLRGQRRWVRTDQLEIGQKIAAIGEPWDQDYSWEAGYLAGIYDGEGWVSARGGEKANARIGFAQAVGPTASYVFELLEKLGFLPSPRIMKRQEEHWQEKLSITFPGRYMDMRFLGSIRPQRLLAKSDRLWEGLSTKSVHDCATEVLSVIPVGVQEVVTIGTSTGTLIADGMLSHNSAGKTLLALKTIAANQARDPKWTTLWFDAERSWDRAWVETLGVDDKRVIVMTDNGMETVYGTCIEFLSTQKVDCIVIDSLPALVPEREDENNMGEMAPGLGALLTGQFFRKQQPAAKRSLIKEERAVLGIMINQWREKIGVMHGDPRTTPGGRGKNFFFVVRLEVKRDDWIEEGDFRVGQTIKAHTIKNKTAAPQRTAIFDFYFADAGEFKAGEYDQAKEIVAVGLQYKLIRRAGAFYSYGDVKVQGRERLLETLRAQPELMEALAADVMASLHPKIGDGVSKRHMKR